MNPYELSTDVLLQKFMDACARAGFSNSGIVISFSAESDRGYAHYLHAAVLARMDQAEPPLKPGTLVQPKDNITRPSPSNGWERQGQPRQLPDLLTVKTVHYLGGGEWEYKFSENIDGATTWAERLDDGDKTWTELRPLGFKAQDFEIITEPVPVR